REQKPQAPAINEGTVQLLMQARNELLAKLEAKQREHVEFRKMIPKQLLGPTVQEGMKTWTDRLNTIDKRRADLRIKKAEAQARLNLIRQVHRQEGHTAALHLIAAAGVKVPPDLKDPNSIDPAVMALEAEIQDTALVIQTLDELYANEQA